MPITLDTYRQVALEDPSGLWEYSCGELRRKSGMTLWHNSAMRRLTGQLNAQLDPDLFEVASNCVRLQHRRGSYYVPDVAVIPVGLMARYAQPSNELESYESAVPFVAEVWSPSTGGFDIDEKIPDYKARGDAEIWRIHPLERVVLAMRLGPGGVYSDQEWRGGRAPLSSLPGVQIDIDRLFR